VTDFWIFFDINPGDIRRRVAVEVFSQDFLLYQRAIRLLFSDGLIIVVS
jgi:hypothetical protein